jgi:hypothetical protein
VDVSLLELVRFELASSLCGMVPSPRKISLAQAVKQGDTALIIYCATFDPKAHSYSGGPRTCSHKREIHMSEALAMFGEQTSLSDLPVRCSLCGGRDFIARGVRTEAG